MSQIHLQVLARGWTQIPWRVIECDGWRQQTKHKYFAWRGLFGGRGDGE